MIKLDCVGIKAPINPINVGSSDNMLANIFWAVWDVSASIDILPPIN